MSQSFGLKLQRDHCAAAGEVHDLYVMRLALVDRRRGLAVQAMTVASAMVPLRASERGTLTRRAPRAHRHLAVLLRILVGHHERRFDPAQDCRPEAVARGLDTHEARFCYFSLIRSEPLDE